MIVIVGQPDEPPVSRLAEEAARLGVSVEMLTETEAASWNLTVDAGPDGLRASVHTSGRTVDLGEATGLYLRITAPRVAGPKPDPVSRARSDAALALLCSWADIAQLRVANRPTAMASNNSKPYQAGLIRRLGFAVPDTVVTNAPDQVRAFLRHHSRIIYKSSSGVRSIVHEATPARLATLDRVRNLPTQFQQMLLGTNVRVHVVGAEVFACEIEAATIDYRYSEGGAQAQMRPVELPEDVHLRCVQVSAALNLPLAGIDLLRDTDDRWWCFEVNPSPAYNCFEEPTRLPIAAALARWLADPDVP
jgi:RimK-like ATP-grasp domain